MATVGKGSITLLADAFSVDDVKRAAEHLEELIAQQRQNLQNLERFVDENRSLAEMVLELPDKLSHHIMVPFGKAAFFPGRLIHTNEFMVLFGEGYYAEKSAKQTVDYLARRSEFLDEKIANVKSQIADLEVEASFASTTAADAKAGVVDIREDYIDLPTLDEEYPLEYPAEGLGQDADGSSCTLEDEENSFKQMLARISELELAEAAADADADAELNGATKDAFTGKVTEHQFKDQLPVSHSKQVAETVEERPISKFRLWQMGRK